MQKRDIFELKILINEKYLLIFFFRYGILVTWIRDQPVNNLIGFSTNVTLVIFTTIKTKNHGCRSQELSMGG